MKLIRIAAIAALLTLVLTTVASATSSDHGRRLAGPFCVSLNTGVLRVVAVNQPCKTGEVRKVGLAIPDVDPAPKPGKTGAAGPAGTPGAPGISGVDGTNGVNGSQGPAGQVTVTQLTGDQAGCIQVTGSDGSSGIVCSTPPAPCPCKCSKGATGPTPPYVWQQPS